MVLGSRTPIAEPEAGRMEARLAAAGLSWERFGIAGAEAFRARRLASAAAVRAALGAGPILRDDRPALEYHAAQRSTVKRQTELYSLLVQITRTGVREDARAGAALLWLESLEAWTAGDTNVSGPIYRSSVGGDYVITPSQLSREEPVSFAGG